MKKLLLGITLLGASFAMAGENINNVLFKDHKTNSLKTISSFKGKTYIKAWASWCPYCLQSLPDLNKLSQEKGLGFNVVSVVSPNHLNEQSTEDFKKWWNSLPEYKNITVLYDEKGEIIKKARVRAYPTNIFVNSKGEIERVQVGVLPEATIKAIMRSIK